MQQRVEVEGLEAVYLSSVTESDLPLFKWLLENHLRRPSFELCVQMHDRALIDHLQLAESYIKSHHHTFHHSADEQMSYHEFITLGAKFLPGVPVANIARYVSQIISLNRSGCLDVDDIVSRLILNQEIVSQDSISAVRSLLAVYLMEDDWSREDTIRLLKLCRPDNNWKCLLDLLGEMSVLSEPVSFLKTAITPEIASYLWGIAYFKTPGSIADKALSLAVKLVLDSELSLDGLELLNTWCEGSLVKQHGLILLSKLIQEDYEGRLMASAFIPDLCSASVDPDVIAAVFRMILVGPSEVLFSAVIKLFDEFSPRNQQIFKQEINSVLTLFSTDCEEDSCECRIVSVSRYGRLLPLMKKHCKTIDLCIPYLAEGLDEEACEIFILEARQRLEVTDLLKFADTVLDVCARENYVQVIEKNQDLLGQKTIDQLARKSPSSPIIEVYFSTRPMKYIATILEQYGAFESTILPLLTIKTPVSSLVKLNVGSITIGRRTYMFTSGYSNGLFYEAPRKIWSCFKCKKHLVDEKLFTDPRENYDVYFCSACSTDLSSVACSVCLGTQRDMRIIECGHTFCTDCVTQLTVCPMCRRDSISVGLKKITREEALAFFMAEWEIM